MRSTLGEFEQLVVLAVLHLGTEAVAAAIRATIAEAAARPVSRGALYATFDRLEAKGYLRWQPGPDARRRFVVTPAGLRAIRHSWSTLKRLGRGLERRLDSA